MPLQLCFLSPQSQIGDLSAGTAAGGVARVLHPSEVGNPQRILRSELGGGSSSDPVGDSGTGLWETGPVCSELADWSDCNGCRSKRTRCRRCVAGRRRDTNKTRSAEPDPKCPLTLSLTLSLSLSRPRTSPVRRPRLSVSPKLGEFTRLSLRRTVLTH
jgi:hypothetical protein